MKESIPAQTTAVIIFSRVSARVFRVRECKPILEQRYIESTQQFLFNIQHIDLTSDCDRTVHREHNDHGNFPA